MKHQDKAKNLTSLSGKRYKGQTFSAIQHLGEGVEAGGNEQE